MAVVVVHKTKCIVGVLGREAVGVGLGDVERRKGGVGGGRRDRAEGGVLVMRGDASRRLVGNQVGHVLVSVVEVEEVVGA